MFSSLVPQSFLLKVFFRASLFRSFGSNALLLPDELALDLDSVPAGGVVSASGSPALSLWPRLLLPSAAQRRLCRIRHLRRFLILTSSVSGKVNAIDHGSLGLTDH